MKKILIVLLSFFLFQTIYAEEEYVRGKILSLEDVITAESGEEEVREVYIYRVRFLSGDRKGDEVSIEYPIYRQEEYNIGAKPGDKVVLYYESNEIGDEKYYISDIDKRTQLLGIAGLFILLTLCISKEWVESLIGFGLYGIIRAESIYSFYFIGIFSYFIFCDCRNFFHFCDHFSDDGL